MAGAAPQPFVMLGSTGAMACEGDACLVPGVVDGVGLEPALDEPALDEAALDEAAAASSRAVTAALDQGASL